jgi:outer membrane protein assembly factor BamA
LQFKRAFSVDRSGILEANRPRGADGRSLLSPQVGLKLDTHTGTFTSRRGIALEVIGRHTPRVVGNPDAFSKLRGQLSGSVAGHVLTDVSLGLRVAGEKNWGRYPFFEAAFLGGNPHGGAPLDVTGASTGNPLRGHDLNRFAGDAAFVTSTELSVALGKAVSVVPLHYGLVGLADAGRVFLSGESSSKWHTGYGGGLWLGTRASSIEFDFATAVKATVVRSGEGTSFNLTSAFGF